MEREGVDIARTSHADRVDRSTRKVEPARIPWRPDEPRTWPLATTPVDVDASIDRLVVVSDLHSSREPIEALDARLAEIAERFQIFVNGDLFEGGIDPVYAVDWTARHAPGRTTRGNHDSRVFRYLRGQTCDEPDGQWAADGELAAYEQLDDRQLRFVEHLPDALLIRWRGHTIRMLHGHQNLKDDRYTNYRLSPGKLMDIFGDPGVDLTLIGHTHYPFVLERRGARLANSGSVSAPLCRFRNAERRVVNRCADDPSVPDDDSQSSFLVISERDGHLHIGIERFDYDRERLLARCAAIEGLSMPAAARRRLVLEGFLDDRLTRGG